MAEARELAAWDRASVLVWKVHNVNCSERCQLIADPLHFNPLRSRQRTREGGSFASFRRATKKRGRRGDAAAVQES